MSHIARANMTVSNVDVNLMDTVLETVVDERQKIGSAMEVTSSAKSTDNGSIWTFKVVAAKNEQVVHAGYWGGRPVHITMRQERDGQLTFEFDQDYQETVDAVQNCVQQVYVMAALNIAMAKRGFAVTQRCAESKASGSQYIIQGVSA